MNAYHKIVPLPIAPGQGELPRRTRWRAPEAVHGVSLRANARLRPALARAQDQPWPMLAAVCRAASAALLLHPRLNFYTFWGRLRWAGLPPKVCAFLENADTSCTGVVIQAAHEMSQGRVIELLRAGRGQDEAPPSLMARLWPEADYVLRRLSGVYPAQYVRHNAPLFVSMLWLAGVDDLCYTPAHSMALYPGMPVDGLMPLTLCYNHQLANARPVGRLLRTIADLLE